MKNVRAGPLREAFTSFCGAATAPAGCGASAECGGRDRAEVGRGHGGVQGHREGRGWMRRSRLPPQPLHVECGRVWRALPSL